MLALQIQNRTDCNIESSINLTAKDITFNAEAYYARTRDLEKYLDDLGRYISNEEFLQSKKFYVREDSETYLSSHAILRLILSRKLNIDPLKIVFEKNKHNKPRLPGNPAYFNISHTREAFAIAFSGGQHIGIDIEKPRANIEFKQVIKTYFSKVEQDYILRSNNAIGRFILLWTRKEALLKAIGTGISKNMAQYEVLDEYKNTRIGTDKGFKLCFSSNHYIFSVRLEDHMLSVATPLHTKLHLNKLNNYQISQLLNI